MKKLSKFDVILSGVGGQGTILASRIVGRCAVIAGLKMRGSELFGMSQRGGAVYSHVRFGDEVESPIINEGSGDILITFEPSEGLRHLKYLSQDGVILVNTSPIIPNTVSLGLTTYPELDHSLEHYRSYAKTIDIDATSIATEAGNPISVNTVMIGAMVGTGRFPIDTEIVMNAIKSSVKPNLMEINTTAFNMGFNKVAKILAQNN